MKKGIKLSSCSPTTSTPHRTRKNSDSKPSNNGWLRAKPNDDVTDSNPGSSKCGSSVGSLAISVEQLSGSESDGETIEIVRNSESYSNGKITDEIVGHPDGSDSEDCEWEDVPVVGPDGIEEPRELKEPVIPKDGVEIILEASDLVRRRRKKNAFDWPNYVRLQVNRFRKDIQLDIHKVHLLCFIGRGMYVSDVANSELIANLMFSVIPGEFHKIKPKRADVRDLQGIVKWFHGHFMLKKCSDDSSAVDEIRTVGFSETLIEELGSAKFQNNEDYVVVFVAVLRLLGFDVRFVCSLQPISMKPTDLIKPKKEEESESSPSESQSKRQKTGKTQKKDESMPAQSQNKRNETEKAQKSSSSASKSGGRSKVTPTSTKSSGRKLRKRTKMAIVESSEDEDVEKNLETEIKDTKKKGGKRTRKSSVHVEDVPKLTTNEEDSDFEATELHLRRREVPQNRKRKSIGGKKQTGAEIDGKNDCNDFWAEVYLDRMSSWVCVDPVFDRVNCSLEMEGRATNPLKYVLTFDNRGKVKDVTQKYAEHWLSLNRKLRVDQEWWKETVDYFRPRLTIREKKENTAIEEQLMQRPLPTTIGEFKSHPLYVLQRHLLKFEAIYPAESIPVGYIRGEPVYSRDCVHTLHSRETWLKQARTVRVGEKPYKVVKARPRWNKMLGQVETDLPLDVFGTWQTEEYIPPIAHDGKVPRNEYGNVDLFLPKMLPAGTVHLRVPRLLKVAKKLGIDCVPAMVGWDYVKMGRPMFDGWIVCEEFQDTLMIAWKEQMKIDSDRANEKRDKRVYGNWRRLIRGLLIRERINLKYFSKTQDNEVANSSVVVDVESE